MESVKESIKELSKELNEEIEKDAIEILNFICPPPYRTEKAKKKLIKKIRKIKKKTDKIRTIYVLCD